MSFFELAGLLSRKGHEVLFFGMEDSRNEVSSLPGHLVSNIEFRDYSPLKALWNARAFTRVLHSSEAASKVKGLIRERMPDLVYVNNIAHHLSPSILDVFAKHRVPVVMHVNDYKMICPNSVLLNSGGVCERCKGEKYYNVLLHRCKRESIVPSAVACIEAYVHRHMACYDSVAAFLAPSRFCRDKLVEFGMDGRKIFVIPNFVDPDRFPRTQVSDEVFCSYFGRLSKEKGLKTLMEAARIWGGRVLVVGDGEEKGELVDHARKLGADNVVFTGRMDPPGLTRTVGQSRFTISPSICYETFGRGIIESYCAGRPVIASRIGAFKELVDEGVDGLLFKPGDPEDLAAKMAYLASSPRLCDEMGEKGRAKVVTGFTAEGHYRQFMNVCDRIRR